MSHETSRPPLPPPAAPTSFTNLSNAFLEDLRVAHTDALHATDDHAIRSTITSAQTVRRAAAVHSAASTIIAIPSLNRNASSRRDDHFDSHFPHPPNSTGDDVANQRLYLENLISRLQYAMQARDIHSLDLLSSAAEGVLDSLLRDTHHDPFRSINLPSDIANPSTRNAPQNSNPDFNSLEDPEPLETTTSNSIPSRIRSIFKRSKPQNGNRDPNSVALQSTLHLCGLKFSSLTKRDKLILWLYLFMVLGALIAVTVVTVDFIRRQINPDSFIRSEVVTELAAPVVTVCLSQTGVPFSRLQLFNFTDAEGQNFRGADPRGPQTERQSASFRDVTDRFWDNPDNENCNDKVGDFYPFPLVSLNEINAGITTTKCRPCYRVGRKKTATVRSTDFRNSSTLNFYTDNYFLQCLKTRNLTDDSLDFLHRQLNSTGTKTALETLEILSSADGQPAVRDLQLDQFQAVSSEQACNIFYFALFPAQTVGDRGGVDVRYQWDGDDWNEVGDGPYFRFPVEKTETSFLPTEALQMFVSANDTTNIDEVGINRDMILIGPNTQTFANMRPAIVYDEPRFDISSSTSNLRGDDVMPIFGYWLVYRVFYNYNRFVVDEWYTDSSYPVSQWLVDFTGYASLFTGASLFSLLLLPLLRRMQRRERQRLREENPEVYVWSRHRRGYQPHEAGNEFGLAGTPEREGPSTSAILLPGYNL